MAPPLWGTIGQYLVKMGLQFKVWVCTSEKCSHVCIENREALCCTVENRSNLLSLSKGFDKTRWCIVTVEYHTAGKRMNLGPCAGMNKSLTSNVEWKKQVGKWIIQYCAIYVKLKTTEKSVFCLWKHKDTIKAQNPPWNLHQLQGGRGSRKMKG